ncbi:MAG: hypothetical protein U0230_21070 [Polyangiales bacterium]
MVRTRTSRSLVVAALAACAVAVGCAPRVSDETPAGALQLFLAAMGESEHDGAALERAYRLLAPESRARLRARAELASSLAHRHFEPWEMMVRGRYGLRFEPRRQGGFVERIEGDRATVKVIGDGPRERAEVPMAREGRAWRVVLAVPDTERGGSRPAGATVSPP